MALLQASGLKKSYKGRQVVQNVSLQVATGQVVGLLGPNGAGKTTFFNVITGLVPSDLGWFELAGQAYKPTAVHKVAPALAEDYVLLADELLRRIGNAEEAAAARTEEAATA
mgnify:CR=1 FL=1